jgi:hypothetical protein
VSHFATGLGRAARQFLSTSRSSGAKIRIAHFLNSPTVSGAPKAYQSSDLC